MTAAADAYPWWSALRHGGLLIAPARLQDHFRDAAEALKPLRYYDAERLRRELTKFAADGSSAALGPFVDVVLEEICGFTPATGVWSKGSAVDTARFSRRDLTGKTVRPDRVYETTNHGVLPVLFTKEKRLGIGLGRREVARVVEWLRSVELPFALATNGRQWRLCYAGLDVEAWCEWETEQWFVQGEPGPQIDALRILLAPAAFIPPKPEEPGRLLRAVRETRSGQAELSKELGENVRKAVEVLIRAYGPALVELSRTVDPRDLYLAATRVVMRMVVALFAEARDLLPRGDAIYHGSYGLQGLREELDRACASGRGERLRHRLSAWPRVTALFRLIHDGSHHADLLVPRYGGALFEAGDPASPDGVRRALAVFEEPTGDHLPDDFAVWEMLDKLCRSRVKVRQGRGATWTSVAVDFADLSTEYIGILYEGLLDYELRRAPPDDPIVFLAVGDEPALPLARLKQIPDADLPDLFKRLGKKSTLAVAADDEEPEDGESSDEDDDVESDDEADDDAVGDEAPAAPTADAATVDDDIDLAAAHRQSVAEWSEHAVMAAKIVAKPRGKQTAATLEQHRRAVTEAAKTLISRVVRPGEWFLVRWGGTRKGAGTFYTPPSLAVPTVHRTLRPLAYDPPADAAQRDVASAWTPRLPEQILSLKVCDPAAGSGSFLIAALRFITDALVAALHRHGRIKAQGEGALVTLAEGKPGTGSLVEETIPARPDAAEFDDLLRARLKRHVVERCIYGVDLDPLAVELARLALWIETMDRALPFDFLEHKLRPGNSLVGCWFDRFRDYPLLAWKREGGDEKYESPHHPKSAWTKAIKVQFDVLRSALAAALVGNRQGELFDDAGAAAASALQDASAAVFHDLHDLPVHEPERKAEAFRARIESDPRRQALLRAFDAWCALWFWPASDLAAAPKPDALNSPSPSAVEVLRRMKADRRHRYFHWELEFPDVFRGPEAGFDAVIGNPPWEIQKPNSKEWFSEHDPLYRGYGKQDALARQKDWFAADARFEERWLEHRAFYKGFSNWTKFAGAPFGDDEGGGEAVALKPRAAARSAELHRSWRRIRATRRPLSDPEHPFRHQGSADLNTYKMFVELAHAIVRRGGRFAFITPSGLYTDKGTTDLRKLLLDRCRLEWLFSFENRRKLFDIDSRFKFGPFIAEKGGKTDAIRTAFMRHDPADWSDAERFATPYARAQVERFSPRTKALLEIRSPRDLAVIEKIYQNSVLLGDDGPDGWGIKYATEFHMTADSKLFPPRPKWEAEGYRPDEYGRWIGPKGEIALPLYQGVMIWQFDFAASRYAVGASSHASWEPQVGWPKAIESQYIMARSTFESSGPGASKSRVAFRGVQNASNERTLIGCVVPPYPCGNSLPTLATPGSERDLPLLAALNSLPLDRVLRLKMSQNNVNWFYVYELPMLRTAETDVIHAIEIIAARLTLTSVVFASSWLALAKKWAALTAAPWRLNWAASASETLRLRCVLDAIIVRAFGLDEADLRWLIRECDYSAQLLADKKFIAQLDPKGFWRVDRERPPEQRHTVLTLVAFHDLSKHIHLFNGDTSAAIADFCAEPEDPTTGAPTGRGWLLPETLRLADYGLGHDDRAKSHQPVRTVLGPRFYDWQLAQSPEESWAECRRHAEALSATYPSQPVVDTSSADGSSIAADAPRVGKPPPSPPPTSIQRGFWD